MRQCGLCSGSAILANRLDQLADRSGVAKRTIVRFEASDGETRETTLTAIRAALEAASVEFIEQNGGGPGVRLKEALTNA